MQIQEKLRQLRCLHCRFDRYGVKRTSPGREFRRLKSSALHGALLRQLGPRTLRTKPFQQKRDANADDNERPDPVRVDVNHVHSRQQEHDATEQK